MCFLFIPTILLLELFKLWRTCFSIYTISTAQLSSFFFSYCCLHKHAESMTANIPPQPISVLSLL